MFEFFKNCFRRKKSKSVSSDCFNNLESQTIETPKWSFKDREYNAKVVGVYDGDTIRVVFKFNGDYYKFSIRLMGIDTPELRTKNENEKKCGYYVKGILEDKILNKIIKLECVGEDKYGRILANIYLEKENINKYLIDNKYAYPYEGGTKKSFEELEEYYKHLL